VTEGQDINNKDETLDDLILGNMKVIQARHGYRFSLDAVLLAHFPELTGVKKVIDLGSGSGVIPVLLAVRANDVQICGVEIQSHMVERALRSISFNGLKNRIEIIHADIREVQKILPGGSAELVLSNPPFWRKGEGLISSNLEEAIARHELNLELEELIEKGSYLLVQGGKMAIIHRAERLEEAIELFRRHKLYPKRLRMVHSFIDRNATLLLLEGRKNRPGKLKILPPLVIYKEPGEYCEEIKRIYREN
jgi:tRNA1Val (adenine37-N6)-methyltransferase